MDPISKELANRSSQTGKKLMWLRNRVLGKGIMRPAEEFFVPNYYPIVCSLAARQGFVQDGQEWVLGGAIGGVV